MALGRPRLSTEQKKLQGTLRPCREKENPNPDVKIAELSNVIFPEGTKISCPKSITTTYVRKYWKTITNNLITLRVLSPQDLPELEHLCLVLEKLRDVDVQLSQCDFTDMVTFDRLIKAQSSLHKQFETLAARYFISPVARQKMTLDNLTIQKTAQEVIKNKDAVTDLLAQRNERRI